MMSTKWAILDLLEIKVFWSKGYDAIISAMASLTKFYPVIQIMLQMWPCNQSWVMLAFLLEKFSKTQFYNNLTRKTNFFPGCSWFRFNNLRLALAMALHFYTSVTKNLVLKVKKFWELISTFFGLPLSWIRLKNLGKDGFKYFSQEFD